MVPIREGHHALFVQAKGIGGEDELCPVWTKPYHRLQLLDTSIYTVWRATTKTFLTTENAKNAEVTK